MGELPDGEPFIVPMAIPMVAGPSGMAAVMLMGTQEPDRMGAWSLALLIAWAATATILFSATYLYKWLGRRVLIAVERLMGMVIVAISVQMLLDGHHRLPAGWHRRAERHAGAGLRRAAQCPRHRLRAKPSCHCSVNQSDRIAC